MGSSCDARLDLGVGTTGGDVGSEMSRVVRLNLVGITGGDAGSETILVVRLNLGGSTGGDAGSET